MTEDVQAIETVVFFRFDGAVLRSGQLPKIDSSREYDQFQFVEECAGQVPRELVRALRAAPEFPERIITVYDPESGKMQAKWDYEGVLQRPDDTYGRARDRWIADMGGDSIFRSNAGS